MNGTNTSSLLPESVLLPEEDLHCPVFTDEDNNILVIITFWLEGVTNCIIASSGLIANLVSAFILSK